MRVNPQQEAYDRLNGLYEVRVLVPSPPAVLSDEKWCADDPTALPQTDLQSLVITPTTAGSCSWDDLAREDPSLSSWCAERWLGAWRRLPQAPTQFATKRRSLQALAEYVISPYRKSVNGKIGLRYTYGGFGTPYLLGDEQLRVDEDGLWLETPTGRESVPTDTLRTAAEALGIEAAPAYGEPELPSDIDAPLQLDRAATSFLGEWFGFGTSVLEQLRAEADSAEALQTRSQIWPEHFDLAIELGVGAQSASFGVSPGDSKHEHPYFYVAPSSVPKSDPFWDAHGFDGAQLGLPTLGDLDDQRSAVLDFFRRGIALLSNL